MKEPSLLQLNLLEMPATGHSAFIILDVNAK